MRFLSILLVSVLTANILNAQYVYTINADSVKITNHCDTAELIIENHTQNVPGFLYNKGRGRTEFRKVLQKVNDTIYMVGPDTLRVPSSTVTASNGLHVDNNVIKLGGTLNQITTIAEGELDFNNSTTGQTSIVGSTVVMTAGGGAGAAYGAELYFMPNAATPFAANPIMSLVGGDSVIPEIDFYSAPNFNASLSSKAGNFTIKTGNTGLLTLTSAGKFGIGTAAPSAFFQLKAGSGGVNQAALKFTSGLLLSTPEDGAVEYDGTDLYVTSASVRYKLSKTLTGQITTGFGGTTLNAFNSFTTSLTVTGAQAGDVVSVSANSGAVNPSSIIITAYVTSANTVTLQAYNASSSSVTLASDTYKVRVIR